VSAVKDKPSVMPIRTIDKGRPYTLWGWASRSTFEGDPQGKKKSQKKEERDFRRRRTMQPRMETPPQMCSLRQKSGKLMVKGEKTFGGSLYLS